MNAMTGRLVNKVAIITGGGSGIGRASAELFASQGAAVVLAEISEATGNEVQRQIHDRGGQATFIRTDVTDAKSVQDMVGQAEKTYGAVHILHNNAVEVTFVNEQDRRVTELPEDVWHRMLAVVLTGVFHCCKYAGRAIARAGVIINTATTDALVGCPGLDAYTAAKVTGGIFPIDSGLTAFKSPVDVMAAVGGQSAPTHK